MTHTPGPWTARARSASDGALVVKSAAPEYIEVCCIAERDQRHPGPDNDRQIADARLIAAAPDLLAALEAIDGMILNEDSDPREVAALCIAIARTTLAKAKG